MFDIARQGGALALKMRDEIQPSLKPDGSVVTDADTAVAAIVHEALKDLLQTKEHILIEEEDRDNIASFNQQALEAASYVWTVDPIDGTRPYANGTPNFAVSIGVLKDLKPWLGVVYFPALRELFFADGQGAYFVREAFTAAETKQMIKPAAGEPPRWSVFLGTEKLLKRYRWDHDKGPILIFGCAASDLCWPAIGRGHGCYFDSYLWDFAGPWPIARAAGLDLRAVEGGEILERIRTDVFEGKGSRTWRLKGPYILSTAREFPLIRAKMAEL